MSTLRRYVLLQLPGWLLAALILAGLRYGLDLPLWAAMGLFFLWVAKDFIIYPFVRTAYESRVKTGAEQLVGTRGRAQERLDPHGYVRVRGELWHAEAEPSDRPILPGSPIRVRAARGLTLIVIEDPNGERRSG